MIFTANGLECRGMLDTGTTRTLITRDIVSAMRPSRTVLRAYDGSAVESLGMGDVTHCCSRGQAMFLHVFCGTSRTGVVCHQEVAISVTGGCQYDQNEVHWYQC